MSMPICGGCDRDVPGMSYVIPTEDWQAICGNDRVLCIWCASERLHKLGRYAKAEISVQLPGINGINGHALEKFHAIMTDNARRGVM